MVRVYRNRDKPATAHALWMYASAARRQDAAGDVNVHAVLAGAKAPLRGPYGLRP
jgi:hypothetical protein